MRNWVAVPVDSPGLDSEVALRFARTKYFLVADPVTMAWSVVENPGGRADGGAGVRTAQMLSEEGVGAVIGVDFGPNTQGALTMAGITMYHCASGATARVALERLGRGALDGRVRRPGGTRGPSGSP